MRDSLSTQYQHVRLAYFLAHETWARLSLYVCRSSRPAANLSSTASSSGMLGRQCNSLKHRSLLGLPHGKALPSSVSASSICAEMTDTNIMQRLIMLLVYGDLTWTTWYFVFAVYSLARGTVRTAPIFCQTSGFFIQYGAETSGEFHHLTQTHCLI